MGFSLEVGQKAVELAVASVEATTQGRKLKLPEGLPAEFDDFGGVFVTVLKHPSHQLRGCIGYPEPTQRLGVALVDAARSAASRDPRFPPVEESEFPDLLVEVTLLTAPERIPVPPPDQMESWIRVGTDGLIVEKGSNRGLLLPQVPVDRNWDAKTFLEQTCWKAGLPKDAWEDRSINLFRFSGQIFCEAEPRGAVEARGIEPDT